MAKLHKVEMYILDSNDCYGMSLNDIVNCINNDYDFSLEGFNGKTVEFEWDDDHPLNFRDVGVEEYRKMFNKRRDNMTRFDYIKSLDIDEMAEFMNDALTSCETCGYGSEHKTCTGEKEECEKGVKLWLEEKC